MSDRIGWIGTGRMGAAMVRRLLDAGHEVTVWNRTTAKTEPLADAGATVAEDKIELAALDVVFVMVSTSSDLEDVLLGEDGLLAGPARPEVVVDCSTVSGDVSAALRHTLAGMGVGFVGAPVSGNPNVVAAGNCCIVASGAPSAFEGVRPLLAAVAGTVVYAGPEDQSRLVKLCHNLYLGIAVQALVEVVTLAEKGGTGREAFLEFLNGTIVSSDWVRLRTPAIVARDWTPTFTTELLRKDFDLGLAEARSREVPLPLGAAVHQLVQSAIGTGRRDDDFLSLYEQQAGNAGLASATTADARNAPSTSPRTGAPEPPRGQESRS
jgi:3-hydroxyisobutyrate dehydrogenase-like beta-hydroxyacid dehydrogenase